MLDTPSLFDLPRTRATDPPSSHLAESAVRPSRELLRKTILEVAPTHHFEACTAFGFAMRVDVKYPGRWDEGTVRAEVSRCAKRQDLDRLPFAGRSPRGQKCDTFFRALRSTVENVSPNAEVL